MFLCRARVVNEGHTEAACDRELGHDGAHHFPSKVVRGV